MKKTNPRIHPAQQTADFYGFLPAREHIKDFKVTSFDETKAKSFDKTRKIPMLEEKIALTRMFFEKKMALLPQPSMIFYQGPMSRDSGSASSSHTFNLEIIGNPKSIADAIVIETAYVITKEEYPDCEVLVELNTVGDKDSLAKLARELKAFYAKNASKVPTPLKPLYRKNIFESFTTADKKAIALRELGPTPLGCLSENSRDHFKEVLEYIEGLKIPYTMNPYLIGDISYGNETVFQIHITHKKTGTKVVAKGQRYNGVARKFLGKKDVSSIGASITLTKNHADCTEKTKEHKYKFFFIQLGFDAKLKSLQVLETFRKAKIPVYQSLSKDKMSGQIAMAEKMNIPYIAIIGKKEAMEESVLIRNMTTRCQDTVLLKELIDYVKKL